VQLDVIGTRPSSKLNLVAVCEGIDANLILSRGGGLRDLSELDVLTEVYRPDHFQGILCLDGGNSLGICVLGVVLAGGYVAQVLMFRPCSPPKQDVVGLGVLTQPLL
jgi:hypothetical protein